MKHSLSFLAIASATLFSLPALAAEEGSEAREPRAEVMLDTVVGLTGEKREGAKVDAIVRSFILEGRLEIARGLDLKLFVPYTHASVRIDGDSNTQSSLGNVGVGLRKNLTLARDTRLSFGAVVTAPTAGGDPLSPDRDQRDKAGLGELSNRIRAFEEDEFFTARRIGLTPRIDFSTVSEGWAYSAYLNVPLLFRSGGESPESFSSTKLHSVAVEGVLAAQVLRQFGELERTEGFAAAFGPRLFLVEVFKETLEDPILPEDNKTQLAFEFLGKLRFGHVLANLGVILPLTGRANEAYPRQHAFRLAIGAAF
jgi:hypothetical protein